MPDKGKITEDRKRKKTGSQAASQPPKKAIERSLSQDCAAENGAAVSPPEERSKPASDGASVATSHAPNPHKDPRDEEISRLKAELAEAKDTLRRNERRMEVVREATGLADFVADDDGITCSSGRFFDQIGIPPLDGPIKFVDWLQYVHPDDRKRLHKEVLRSMSEEEHIRYEFRIIRADTGEVRWLATHSALEHDLETDSVKTIGAHLDITDRKRAEETLRESEARFRLAAEAAGLGVWDYDIASDSRKWSSRINEIFGFASDAEPNLQSALDCLGVDDRDEFIEILNQTRDGDDRTRFKTELRISRADNGAKRWIAIDGWKSISEDGDLGRVIMTVRDITDEKTAEERIRWTANHDTLTGLGNRALFQERLSELIASAHQSCESVGLLLLDIDHFKQINDSIGHDAGDMLLQTFAERLKEVVRKDDVVARFGGDEFAIILPNLVSEKDIDVFAENLLDRLREPFVHQGQVLDCRASIGTSLFPLHGYTPDELMKSADMALYAAKSSGRSNATRFDPKMRDEMQIRRSMVHRAREAIASDRIMPYYQPKLDLRHGTIVGFEALLRWKDAHGRTQLPGKIDAAFDDLDVAAAISDRMIDGAIADMRDWLDKGIEFGHVAVNASAAEFRRNDFAERVLKKLGDAQIPVDKFQLEVTETVFLGRGAEFVHRALGLLHKKGVEIALDDFGTGYASLRHLKQFPVDIIKVDRSFVRDMEDDPGDEAIIRAVINLGQSLNIDVVAEGIETHKQAEHLLLMGCDIGQGFLFSPAMPASHVPGFLLAFGVRTKRDDQKKLPAANTGKLPRN